MRTVEGHGGRICSHIYVVRRTHFWSRQATLTNVVSDNVALGADGWGPDPHMWMRKSLRKTLTKEQQIPRRTKASGGCTFPSCGFYGESPHSVPRALQSFFGAKQPSKEQ